MFVMQLKLDQLWTQQRTAYIIPPQVFLHDPEQELDPDVETLIYGDMSDGEPAQHAVPSSRQAAQETNQHTETAAASSAAMEAASTGHEPFCIAEDFGDAPIARRISSTRAYDKRCWHSKGRRFFLVIGACPKPFATIMLTPRCFHSKAMSSTTSCSTTHSTGNSTSHDWCQA